MKRYLFVCLFALVAVCPSWSQSQNEAYLAYINEWKSVAIQNQKDYGIPASIVMAQALLESAAGQSELARKANNHFGIKSTNDWTGGKYHYKNAVFRKYRKAADSYKDHALFLLKPRYAPCFELAVEDYAGWANKLRECGYATDKQYAPKLIKIIEDYRLDLLGKGKPVGKYSAESKPASTAQKATVVSRSEPIRVINKDPDPEYVKPLTAYKERRNFFKAHPRKRCNGVRYVVANEEDTYANVAFRLNRKERDLRIINDALGRDLKAGDRIYLMPKKCRGTSDYVWATPGQTLWELCQEEGVKMKSVRKYNGFSKQIRVLQTRQKIYLRKVKDKE